MTPRAPCPYAWITATNSRADSAAGRSRTNQRPPPPPIFSSHNDQHPRAVEPYRQRQPGTTGSPRATIGRQPDPHRCPKGSSPTHGNRSTRLVTAHPQKPNRPNRPQQPHGHDPTANGIERRRTAAASRPAVLPEFLPPCRRKVIGRTAPVGKQARQETHAPTPSAPGAADDRRPSNPTT